MAASCLFTLFSCKVQTLSLCYSHLLAPPHTVISPHFLLILAADSSSLSPALLLPSLVRIQCLQRWSLQHTGSKFPKLLSSKNLFASLLQLHVLFNCACLTIWHLQSSSSSFLPTVFQPFWDLWVIDLVTFLSLIPLLPFSLFIQLEFHDHLL